MYTVHTQSLRKHCSRHPGFGRQTHAGACLGVCTTSDVTVSRCDFDFWSYRLTRSFSSVPYMQRTRERRGDFKLANYTERERGKKANLLTRASSPELRGEGISTDSTWYSFAKSGSHRLHKFLVVLEKPKFSSFCKSLPAGPSLSLGLFRLSLSASSPS